CHRLLWLPPRRPVAPRLYRRSGGGALPECLRRRDPGVPEAGFPSAAGADIDRAAFSGNAIARAGGFRPAGSSRGHAPPAPDSPRVSCLTSSSKEENSMKTSNEKTSQTGSREVHTD